MISSRPNSAVSLEHFWWGSIVFGWLKVYITTTQVALFLVVKQHNKQGRGTLVCNADIALPPSKEAAGYLNVLLLHAFMGTVPTHSLSQVPDVEEDSGDPLHDLATGWEKMTFPCFSRM